MAATSCMPSTKYWRARCALSKKHRAEAVSLKKLLQGDGSWNTQKIILGWIIDTLQQTLKLPAHRKRTLAQIFTDLRGRKQVTQKAWRSILGKLIFMSVAIPGSTGLLSAMQLALNKATQNCIMITRHLRHHIHEFAMLVADLCSRPKYLPEIVAKRSACMGSSDAAKCCHKPIRKAD